MASVLLFPLDHQLRNQLPLTPTNPSDSTKYQILMRALYTPGVWAHREGVSTSTTFLTRKQLSSKCSCATDGVRTSGLWISSPTLYQLLSHPVTPRSGNPNLFHMAECNKFVWALATCTARFRPSNKKVTPYKRFQSQGQVEGHA